MIENPVPGQRCWYFCPTYPTWNPGQATVLRTLKRVVVRFDRFRRPRSVAAKHLYATKAEYDQARGN